MRNPEVLAVRVADLTEKELLLSSDEDRFFTEPHYNGFPAVLVRLRAVGMAELEALLTAAWRCQAPPELAERLSRGRGGGPGVTGQKRGAEKTRGLRRRPRKPAGHGN